eukprot:gene8413-9895_t
MIDSFCDQPVAKLPPHVYAIAEASYRELLNNQANQSILVSGESGAGKTETTKFLLQYFAAMGEKRGQSVQETLDNNNIEAQVIKSTPILEAFGNAKTLRNDNSSRFGKFIQIHFDKTKGTIIGANLETYLLEKSRIVRPPASERSFHIFYQFLAGVSEEIRSKLNVSSNPLDFEYLKTSGCYQIDDVDDAKVYLKTEKALRIVGFTDDDLMGVYKLLAAILHCGNIQFIEKEENAADIVDKVANEKLQNQFNHQIFKLEQLEYTKEKIDWSYIEFNDNQDCIDLIEKKPLGILSILDEESQFPKSTPTTLSNKLYSNHTKTKHFEKPRFSNTHFTIDHYAGKVNYDTELFLDKNKDFIISEQVMALQASGWDFFKKLLGITTGAGSGGDPKKPGAGPATAGKQGGFKFLSVSSQFRESLNHLMTTINTTNPHYIRCIKPNSLKVPNNFDKPMVLQQLRCGGVIEQLRISRSGYPGRFPYENFFKRYKLLAAGELSVGDQKTFVKDARKGSEILINKLRIDEKRVQFGTTKIFFKSGIIANLELIRGDLLRRSAIAIQRRWKGYKARKMYVDLMHSTILLQTLVKRSLASKMYAALLEEQATIALQTALRSSYEAKVLRNTMEATMCLQTALRGAQDSLVLTKLVAERAALVLQGYMRTTNETNKLNHLIRQTTRVQARWRGKMARREYTKLRIEARSLNNVVAEKNKLETKVEELQYRLKAEQKIKEKASDEKEKIKAQHKAELDAMTLKYQDLVSQSAKEIQELKDTIQALQKVETPVVQTIAPTDPQELLELRATIAELQSQLSEAKQPTAARVEKIVPTDPQEVLALHATIAELQSQLSEARQYKRPVVQETRQDDKKSATTDLRRSMEFSDVPLFHTGEDETALAANEAKATSSPSRINNKEAYPEFVSDDDDSVMLESSTETVPRYRGVIESDHLQQEIALLHDRDETRLMEIEQLNKKLIDLREQLEHEREKNVLRTSNNSSSFSSPRNSSITSPHDNTVKSISYIEFNNSPPKDNANVVRPRSASEAVSTITDLNAALEINNNVVGAGRFLVDMLMKEDVCFVSTIPEPSLVVARCFLEDIIDQNAPAKIDSTYYFIDSVEQATRGSSNNETLIYWLSNITLLINVLNMAFESKSVNQQGESGVRHPSMEVLQIKTQFQNLLLRIYKTLVRNILEYIQPICHRALNDPTSDTDIMEPLTQYLTKLFKDLQKCHIYDPLRQLLFEQIFTYINSLLFNEIVLRRDLCCLRSSIHLKINISELEHWAKNYGREWSSKAIGHLSALKEAIYILMIDKTLLTSADIRKEVCPSISSAQLKQLLTMYSPDLDSVEDPIPLHVISAIMESSDYNKSENILLDISSIFTLNQDHLHCLTLDDLHKVSYTCDSLVSLLMKKNMENALPGAPTALPIVSTTANPITITISPKSTKSKK